MAKGAIFITWGRPLHENEALPIQLFDLAVSFCKKLIADQRIESFRVFVNTTGDTKDWAGTLLLEGRVDLPQNLQRDRTFQRLLALADDAVENVRVALTLGDSPDDVREAFRTYAGGLPPLARNGKD